jgi:hypothetical protein
MVSTRAAAVLFVAFTCAAALSQARLIEDGELKLQTLFHMHVKHMCTEPAALHQSSSLRFGSFG